jgi:hypothetical protein
MSEAIAAIVKLLGALLLLAVMVFISPLIGVIFGAFSGWVVGLFWTNTLTAGLAAVGITGLKLWQIGATLGFVGGFFKTSVTSKSKDD